MSASAVPATGEARWHALRELLENGAGFTTLADGAAAAHSHYAREDAARKLITNHQNVLKDVCNPSAERAITDSISRSVRVPPPLALILTLTLPSLRLPLPSLRLALPSLLAAHTCSRVSPRPSPPPLHAGTAHSARAEARGAPILRSRRRGAA